MAWDQVIRIDLLHGRKDMSDVVVVERRNDMEATDDGMHLLEAGRDLRLPDRVNDPAMAAGGENYETLALDDEVGADLVLKIVRMKVPVFLGKIRTFPTTYAEQSLAHVGACTRWGC